MMIILAYSAPFKTFLIDDKDPNDIALDQKTIIPDFFSFGDLNAYEETANAYVAGFYAKKLMKLVKKCSTCTSDILSEPINDDKASYIKSRDYTGKSLFVSGKEFYYLFCKCSNVVDFFMQDVCVENSLKDKLRNMLYKYVFYDFKFTCLVHDLKKIFCNSFLTFFIRFWCKTVGRHLTGKHIHCNINDPVKRKALIKCRKNRALKRVRNKQKRSNST